MALPRDTFSRVVRWLTGHAFLRLQNFRADSTVTPNSVCRYCSCRPERADHILLKCVRLRLLSAECFGPWDLSRTRPEWELSQVLKFLASPKILALEDQEQEARNLDFWEPTDSEARWWTWATTHTAGDALHLQHGRLWQGQIAHRARSSEESNWTDSREMITQSNGLR